MPNQTPDQNSPGKNNPVTQRSTALPNSPPIPTRAPQEVSPQPYPPPPYPPASARQAQTDAVKPVAEFNESLLSHAKDTLGGEITNRKDQTARDLGSVAAALHQTSQKIQRERGGETGTYVETVAGEVKKAAAYLDRLDFESILRDTESSLERSP